MGVDVHRHADALQQFGQALELEAHHRTADVVGVVVGDQHAGQVHAVGLQRVDQVAGGVGRVDDHGVAGLPVADQVGEVAHLLGDHVAGREIATREQLPEVEPVRVSHALSVGSRRRHTAPGSSCDAAGLVVLDSPCPAMTSGLATETGENVPSLRPTARRWADARVQAPLAQSVERFHGKEKVNGSIPLGGSVDAERQRRTGVDPGRCSSAG